MSKLLIFHFRSSRVDLMKNIEMINIRVCWHVKRRGEKRIGEMAEECTVVRFTRDPSAARIETLKNESPDKFQEQNTTFGAFYVICVALSIITYVLDLVLACVLLYFYSVNKQGVYFALTLTFILVPALFMTTVSLRW